MTTLHQFRDKAARYLFNEPQFTSMMPKTVWGLIIIAEVMALIFISLWFYKQKKAII